MAAPACPMRGGQAEQLPRLSDFQNEKHATGKNDILCAASRVVYGLSDHCAGWLATNRSLANARQMRRVAKFLAKTTERLLNLGVVVV